MTTETPAQAPPATGAAAPVIDAVVIGRNEGERLVAGLTSLQGKVRRLVYVDSGSTDGSVAAAHRLGAEVIALDPAVPFTAARARNAGLAHLAPQAPEFVQMLDGDCSLQPGWLETGAAFLRENPKAALVFGRLRERFPEASVYNRLCDWEWDVPVGQVRACGGAILLRWPAIRQVDGYRDGVIAAEDDEMCQRLLAAGWQLWRVKDEMAFHDAAIFRLGQWWRRNVRAGHGFAEVGALHPGHFVAARRRMWIWGAVLPLLFVIFLFWQWQLALVVLALYAASFARGLRRFRRGGMTLRQAAAASGLITLSKLPNLQGALTYYRRRWRGEAPHIIEYK